MLPDYLLNFNNALSEFQLKFPRASWTESFHNSLVNDYSFYSSRVEDSKLEYGDTIRFLNNESIRGINLKSLGAVAQHQEVLKNLLAHLNNFDLSEETIKRIHGDLMESESSWSPNFHPELVGQYRNIPTVGSREPYFENKEYAAHYNLEIIMAGYVERFNERFGDIDNSLFEKHLLTTIAFFHNKFLNEIHPFADGNGRVCRIIIGAVLMNNGCPPIFPEIVTQEQQIEYITSIVQCEQENNDTLLIKYLAEGMTAHLISRIASD